LTGGLLLSAVALGRGGLRSALEREDFADLTLVRRRALPPLDFADWQAKAERANPDFAAPPVARPPFPQDSPVTPLQRVDHLIKRTDLLGRISRGIVNCAPFRLYGGNDENRVRALLPGPLVKGGKDFVFWDLMIEFPGEYPFESPRLRFIAIPPLNCVSEFGRVDLVKGIEYHPRMELREVLLRMYRVIVNEKNWERSAGVVSSREELDAAWARMEIPLPLRRLGDLVRVTGCDPRDGSDAEAKEIDEGLTRIPLAYSQASWAEITKPDERKKFEGWTVKAGDWAWS
jgi:hypothetical protein